MFGVNLNLSVSTPQSFYKYLKNRLTLTLRKGVHFILQGAKDPGFT